MSPNWLKLVSLAQKLAHSSFSSSMHSLPLKDNLFKNIFLYTLDQLINLNQCVCPFSLR